jgi:hypothetical protein
MTFFYSFHFGVKTARTDVELYKALRQVSKLSQMVSHPSVLPVHRYKTLSFKKIIKLINFFHGYNFQVEIKNEAGHYFPVHLRCHFSPTILPPPDDDGTSLDVSIRPVSHVFQ